MEYSIPMQPAHCKNAFMIFVMPFIRCVAFEMFHHRNEMLMDTCMPQFEFRKLKIQAKEVAVAAATAAAAASKKMLKPKQTALQQGMHVITIRVSENKKAYD